MMKVLRLAITTIGLLMLLLPLTGAAHLAEAHVAVASKSWSLTGSMKHARVYNTMTLLANGQVLVAGGINADNSGGNPALASAELYDPTTGTWSPTSSLNHARTNHTATKLTSGQVLVAGGVPSGGGGVNGPPMATAELYG